MAAQNSGLAQRGLVLLGLLLAVVAGVWFFLFRTPSQETPTYQALPEMSLPMLATPSAGFPASIAWAPMIQLDTTLPSAPGWEIRYNATRALAQKGSRQLPFDVLRDMLDEGRQMQNFFVPQRDGRRTPNEALALKAVVNALQSLTEWHKHSDAVAAVGKDNPELQKVYDAVAMLARSSNNAVRVEAEKTLKALGVGPH